MIFVNCLILDGSGQTLQVLHGLRTYLYVYINIYKFKLNSLQTHQGSYAV